MCFYFFSPTDLFFSLRSEALHFLHLSAASGFLAPHLRQTLRKSLLFWAICFFVTSAMGNFRLCPSDYAFQVVACLRRPGTSDGVIATLTPASLNAAIFESAVPKLP